ncbi:MAG: efflux RND transporter periplasmic adaptor subunit [Elusimicrobiales bacterium]|nr:efflux RND transporter periplasmic adaptor subunit [Elusimicrobiales bacterium]MCK5583182.1 efflux RND transporter periplasmic adaptor subunit [Elusimicrobiales bacterium]
MKKVLVFTIILILTGSGIYYYQTKKGKNGVKYIQSQAISKNMSKIIDTTGEVEPLNRVEITPSSPGRVEKILVKEGDKISVGQTLALMSSQDRVAIMDAARSMDEKEYEYWKNAYKPIKIISPLDGTIILKNVVESQTVGASTVLFAMSDRLIISANVDESDIGRVKVGQKAEIILDAYPQEIVKGRIFQILDEGKNVSNVIIYKIKIMSRRLPSFFKSKMTANIKIYLAKRKSVIVAPSNSITVDEDGDAVIITGFNGEKPVYTKVKTGNDFQGRTEIISGLEDGDSLWYEDKKYIPQKSASEKNPFMPKRPGRGRGNKGKNGAKKSAK